MLMNKLYPNGNNFRKNIEIIPEREYYIIYEYYWRLYKTRKKKSWIDAGRICNTFRIRSSFCMRIGTWKGNRASG